MAKAEQALEDIAKQMEEYASSSDKLLELSEQQTEAEAKLEHLMERWTYLNELAEKIEAQKKG